MRSTRTSRYSALTLSGYPHSPARRRPVTQIAISCSRRSFISGVREHSRAEDRNRLARRRLASVQ